MNKYYFEYKEGENVYCGIVSAPTDHAVPELIRDHLTHVPWTTEQGGEFVGLAMFTPSDQLDDVEKYASSQTSPYTDEDWAERLDRAKRMEENGDNVIEVEQE